MSLIWTESFMQFGRETAADSTLAASNAARVAHIANLKRAGYQVTAHYVNGTTNSAGFLLRNDPLLPDRAALVPSVAGSTNPTTMGIFKEVPASPVPLIFGFSVVVPLDFVKVGADAALPMMRIIASTFTDAAWLTSEVCSVRGDLQIGYKTVAPQSGRALVPGRVSYIEVRISLTDTRVWLDDMLVLQVATTVASGAVGIAFPLATQTSMSGTKGQWAISNMYCLFEDGVLPNARLGPTTRVIGLRPASDVTAQFTRPAGFASNAAVVGQDLVDEPINNLQSIDTAKLDSYLTPVDAATSAAAKVHAVSIKTLSANLEAVPHRLRGFARVGLAQSPGEAVGAMALRSRTAFTAKNILASALRADGTSIAVGSGAGIWRSSAISEGGAWATVSEDTSAIILTGVAVDSTGQAVACRSDGQVQVSTAAGDLSAWALVGTGVATAMAAVAVGPDGLFVISPNVTNGAMRTSTTPAVAASWTARTALTYPPQAIAYGAGRFAGIFMGGVSPWPTCYSNDGLTWTVGPGAVYPGAVPASMAFGAGLFVAPVFHNATNLTMRVSSDGINWTSTTPVAGAGAAGNFQGISFVNGMFVAVGNFGAICVSNDGLSWRQLARPLPSASFRTVLGLPNGKFMVLGDAGAAVMLSPTAADTEITPFAGYQPTYSVVTLNPATGNPWTPAEAASSEFGMRLMS